MKTIITTILKLNLIILVLLSSNTIFAQIESSGFGGLWSDGATWIGGNVPGPADDVIINGPVIIDGSVSCNNMTISAGGIANSSSGNRTLTVNGNFTNHGYTADDYYNLTINIHGDIYHDGVWQNEYTYLMNATSQDIWSSEPFNGSYFNNTNATNVINITSNTISFLACRVDLGDGNMVFGNGNLSLTGYYLTDAVITCDELDFTVNGSAYISNTTCIANHVWLNGGVTVKNNVVFNDNTLNVIVEVVDTLQNSSSNNYTLIVDGDLHNQGLIRDDYYNLSINVSGSIINNGQWTNYLTNLNGNTNQYLTFNQEFACENFTSTMVSPGVATGTNALRFNGTKIDFNSDSLYMNAGYDSIFVDGGYVYDITIIAGASPWQVYFHQSNSAWFDDVIIESEDAVLDGVSQFKTFFDIIGNARVEGILQNHSATNYTVTVTGNMTNNGTIQDNYYNNYLYIGGDIFHNGTWTNDHTYLTSDDDQGLMFTTPFEGIKLTNSNTDGKVISHSTLNFISTIIDFNYDTLMFAAGADSLLLSGDYFQEGVIIKEGSKTAGFLHCTHTDNAYFHDAMIVGDNIDLGGVFQFTSPMSFYGHVTVNGTLQNQSNTHHTAYVYGNLSNNGTIRDNYYNNSLYISGDIFQNGIWTNDHTYLSGDDDQSLTFTTPFQGIKLTNSNTNGKVISNSTLAFISTIIDFNYDTLMFSANADSLIIDNKYFQEVVIVKEGAKTSGFLNCTMMNSGYFHDAIIIGDNIDLGGDFQYSNPMSFYGHVTVSGILQNNGSSHYTAYIYGNITNNGTIQNNFYNNTLYITGDIFQNGVWSNNYNYLSGDATQNLSQTSPFTCYRIVDTDPLSAVQATSDLDFQNTDVDLGGATLEMPNNSMLTITDSWFFDANVTSSSTSLSMMGNSYLENTSLQNASLYEFVQVKGGCTFLGEIKVVDTLSNYGNSHYTLNIDGDITNSGSIQNNTYNLYLNISGHLINNGTWTNYRTTLNGATDQSIYLINDQEISGQVYFDALSAGSPYQWYHEGGILDSPDFTGETGNSLVWTVPVSSIWYGDFNCQTGAGQSRTITVEGGLILDLAVLLEGPFNGEDMNTTLNANSNLPLTQPYNMSPWNYTGSESVVSIPPDVVDWILLEFRETAGGPATATPGTMITQRAFFLRNDGTIVNLDGTPDIRLNAPTVNDNLFVVVHHRNHLGVMSANPISFDIAPLDYNFTSGESQAYGGALGQNYLGAGKYGMMGGNANSDSDVDGADFLIWQNNAGSEADYDRADFNMNNQVNNLDKNDILVGNAGQSVQVPE